MMRKYNSFMNKPDKQPLLIKSIIVKEGLKGFIYIEAFKQSHVKTAIEDVGNLKMGVWKQEMVPFKEMPDVLKIIKDVVKLRIGSWVRLKRSIYKDDLAQVDQVDTAQNQVTLRLVPRIDYAVKRGAPREPDSKSEAEKEKFKFGGFKRKLRPAQRLFDSDAVKEIGGMPTREKDNWIFENNRYTSKGYLIKSFPMSMIMSEGVKPTLTELQKFEELPDGVDAETAGLLTKSSLDKSHNFMPGDVVEVRSGELIHLTGSVIGIDGDKIRMVPNHEELKVCIFFFIKSKFYHLKAETIQNSLTN
jgi:transcription elongation factor SPT5